MASAVSCADPAFDTVSPGDLYSAPSAGSLYDSYTNNGARVVNFSWGSDNNTYGVHATDIDVRTRMLGIKRRVDVLDVLRIYDHIDGDNTGTRVVADGPIALSVNGEELASGNLSGGTYIAADLALFGYTTGDAGLLLESDLLNADETTWLIAG